MPPTRSSAHRHVRQAAAGSWIALVAATTLGDAADTVRAEVRADGLADGNMYRLVVQSYDRRAPGSVPGRGARPVGSAQRAVTADELRTGVHINLLELRQAAEAPAATDAPLVVAWIEPGLPDLEFDGRNARPRPGTVYGTSKRAPSHGIVQISLDRTLTA